MKKNLNIIILGLAALSLSSCKTLYGKYERPDVKTSGIVRDVASDTDTLAVKDTTTFANIPWRSVFTDPQLQSIIEKGLNNNVNLLNAALNVKIAEEQLKCAKLAFVPSLAFTPQGTIASWDGQAATKTYTMPVTASWMVDLSATCSLRSAVPRWRCSSCRIIRYLSRPTSSPTSPTCIILC